MKKLDNFCFMYSNDQLHRILNYCMYFFSIYLTQGENANHYTTDVIVLDNAK
jgi:hypothetical protein